MVNQLLQNIGLESQGTLDHAEWSMEAMDAEINAMGESQTHEEELAAYATLESAAGAELVIVTSALADISRLSATESEEAAEEIMRGYGLTDEFAMEAAKDVLARGAYAGAAKIKAAIAAVLKWIQSIITFSANTRKAYAKVEKMAKNQIKALKGKAGSKKITEDKFSKELVDFATLTYKGTKSGKPSTGTATGDLKTLGDTIVNLDILKAIGITNSLTDTDFGSKLSEAYSDFEEEIKDAFDRGNKTEYEKSALLAKVIERCRTVENEAKANKADKTIKELEKAKKDAQKLTSDSKMKAFNKTSPNKDGLEAYVTFASNLVTLVTTVSKAVKRSHKETISAMDTILTEAKAVEAMAA
ncbi:MAG: hypothetical protein ACRC92_14790 [Peptostreptococcaceae bacterium]